jgi:CTP synthase
MKQKKERHFIFVVGGVMSGVGKGVTAASIGMILQSKGYTVTALKIDPYINVDAGTMNPTIHGEVFVTTDGDETDQDIGNYERFMNIHLTRTNYMTTGRVYQTVINKERNLEYGGRDVEVVPDIPNEVIRRIKKATKDADADFTIIEIGGTVGEYQNLLFLEAARMMKLQSPGHVQFVLVSYLPIPKNIGEMKTKPTQYAARTLNSAGIQTDFVICRAEDPLDAKRKQKVATFCNVMHQDVISAPDVTSIYNVPINFEKQQLGNKILAKFSMKPRKLDMAEWRTMVRNLAGAKQKVTIGIVGKYFASGNYILSDVYISVIEAIKHACAKYKVKPELHWIDSVKFEGRKPDFSILKKMDGVIVPGGFGSRGITGVIRAIEFVRVNKIPYLGLCYGMQLATIEFARNVAKIHDADTVEIRSNTKDPIIHINEEQQKNVASKNYGNTMRLGAYRCRLHPNTLARKLYGAPTINERHRHRYEFNDAYRDQLADAGMVFSGACPDNGLVEIVELPQTMHPYFIGSQFHPEFQSYPIKPHPLFAGLIRAALKK